MSSRPKKQRAFRKLKNDAAIIDRELMKMVEVSVDGQRQHLVVLEAIIRQLSAKEVAGSRKAVRVRMRFEDFANRFTKPQRSVIFVESDYTRSVSSSLDDDGSAS